MNKIVVSLVMLFGILGSIAAQQAETAPAAAPAQAPAAAAPAPAAAPATVAPAAPAAPAVSPMGEFEGKSFDGRLVPEGKKRGDKDVLSFKDGKFTSSACVKYGFLATSFSPTLQDGKTRFRALVQNKKGETMDWQGTLDGGKLTANAVYTNKKGKPSKYDFVQNEPKKAK